MNGAGAQLHGEVVFRVDQPRVRNDRIGRLDVILEQRLHVRRFHILPAQISAARDLDGVGQAGQGGADFLLPQRNRLRQRGGHHILQQLLIATQRFAVPHHHLCFFFLKRHRAHRDQHDENQVQNRNPGR